MGALFSSPKTPTTPTVTKTVAPQVEKPASPQVEAPTDTTSTDTRKSNAAMAGGTVLTSGLGLSDMPTTTATKRLLGQ